MSIPMKKKITLIKSKITESVSFNDKIIDESLHVFNNQYEVSGLLADLTINALKYKKEEFTISVEKYKLPCKEITVVINSNNLYPALSANIYGLSKTGRMVININVISNFLVMYDNKTAYSELKNAIAHELEHSFSILNRYQNTGKEDWVTSDNLYMCVTNIMHNSKDVDDVYYFAYALYNVFGHEMDAFVSQCYGEVYDYLTKLDNIKNEDIREALKNSETYKAFTINLKTLNFIYNKYTEEKKNNFISRFNEQSNGIFEIENTQELNNLLKDGLNRNNMAIKNCHGVAMRAYYNLIGK